MNKFQYLIRTYELMEKNTYDIEDEINEIGDDGWELCNVIESEYLLKCFFKRMKKEVPTNTGAR
jgi:hypothetical protein